MGMSDDEICELVNQFLPYKDWRMETSLKILNEMIRSMDEASTNEAVDPDEQSTSRASQ